MQTRAAWTIQRLTRPLVLWHLLSLDAPSVAALWTWTIARSVGLRLAPIALSAMFLAVWILYVADRLLDSSVTSAELEARHRFHARNRRPFRWALALGCGTLAPLLLTIPAVAMRLYLELGVLLFAWFILIHVPAVRPGTPPRRLPKELAVGVFFSAAVFIPTVSRLPALRLTLLPEAIAFAALCSLNCLFIYTWEHPSQQSRVFAHPTTRLALRHLVPITFGVILLAATITALQHSRPAFATALSAALLLALNRWPPRDATLLRAAADLTLITPLLFL